MDQAIEKYNLTADYIYNWDKKGFLIGQANTVKHVMTRKAFESGRICHASQDRNREFITLLACISALGRALPPCLIYIGESGDLQESWLADFNTNDKAYFGVSSIG